MLDEVGEAVAEEAYLALEVVADILAPMVMAEPEAGGGSPWRRPLPRRLSARADAAVLARPGVPSGLRKASNTSGHMLAVLAPPPSAFSSVVSRRCRT